MSSFPPILILAIIWLLIGLPFSKLNKAAQKKTAGTQKPKAPKTAPAEKPAPPIREAVPVRPAVFRPSIAPAGHDDSVYQGSLGAVTGEGYDPCHDEQLSSLTEAESRFDEPETASPGLTLNWTGSEIVRGIVISEILKRKT